MSLNSAFLREMNQSTHRTNVVVVFSPKDTFYSTVRVSTPFGNTNFNGSQSYILWKREPDATSRGSLDVKRHFSAFLDNQLTESELPLNCIDSVSIAGGELDIKDAAVQDDGVSINVVLQDVAHKSFFQDLVGYNVEIYLGFSQQNFNFFDYERFYVGKLNGLSSPSNLTLQLKVGTLVDFWNKTWVHSQGLTKTKTAYPYPLYNPNANPDSVQTRWNDAIHNLRDGDFSGANNKPAYWGRHVTSRLDLTVAEGSAPFKFESDLYRAITNVQNYYFDYEYNYPRYRTSIGTGIRTPLPDNPDGSRATGRDLKPWSAVFFIPSGTKSEMHKVAPDLINLRQVYPTVDENFLKARLHPSSENRIRFRLNDVVFESGYIDVYNFWPLCLVPKNASNGSSVTGNRYFIFDVERMPNNPEAAQNADIDTLNALSPLSTSTYKYVLDGTLLRDSWFPNTQSTYESIYYRSYTYEGINRLKFATKLRVFVEPNGEFGAEAGSDVHFYDTKTGIGEINEVLINTLTLNLGINQNLIDQNSFRVAKETFETLMHVPTRGILGDNPNLRGGDDKANSDYCFDGEGESTEHVQNTILKSNNLRMYTDRGVLKCLFMQTRDKTPLLEEVNGEFVPFLISEDDILESTTYETRPEEQVKRLKVNTSFAKPNSADGDLSFYCVDNRNQDRTSGTIVVAKQPGVDYTEDDFEEVDVRQNFTDSTRTENHLSDGTWGPVGSPYKATHPDSQAIYMTLFANYYFDAINPYIKLTLTTGARGLQVSVGDIIVVRDHQAFELFGSQFIKAFVINKTISDWGTGNLNVTLDVLFVGKSTDFLEADRPTRPNRLRLLSTQQSTVQPESQTQAVVTFDAPDDWGHEVDRNLFTYRVYETTPTGDRFLASLPENRNLSNSVLRWTASTRNLSLNLDNDKTYHLFVRADNGAFEGPASNVLEFETLDSVVPPSAPLNLRIESSDSTNVNLVWDAVASLGGAPSVTYNVYVNDVYDTNVGGQLAYSFGFEGRTPASVIEFYVKAQNDSGESVASNIVRFTVPQPLPVPEGVINLSGIGTGISATRLTWSANITRGDVDVLYALHRSDRAGTIGPVINSSIIGSPIDDVGLEADTTYYYTIVARNASGEGVNSAQVAVKTFARIVRTVPRAPTGFRVG